MLVYIVVKRPFAGWGRPAFSYNPVATARSRRRMKREREAWEAERRARIAKLSADPALRPYAQRIEAGEAWNDDQIAYDRNPQALATCRHLAPIERAVDEALASANLPPEGIDRVFLTGGSSFVPAVRAQFENRFGAAKIETGDQLVSIAFGLSLIAQEPDIGRWVA